ncbi:MULTISPECIES: hypothetical protein [unclassified Tenacibaculum]|uniref:hypothetical protein n=1 Tax=unclassified Tenacibaculum TaxID=2635139 RepID=UPI001F3A79EE|nr:MULTISPECIES: hypothetical protein [unclassified Tenacibaculum]MCF2874031.1 hypothetical protein [Tenacibaculum sp. Cn5-1]MCF2934612.1 hypothetical protein [Tenacibaculum sp. Cn5-34]MCG7510822.1 hypothetical protein [Tenacibaculum sp. Cn5-46]
MLKKISKSFSLLTKNEQKNVVGGNGSYWCDIVFKACHENYDSDEDYLRCMEAHGCKQNK